MFPARVKRLLTSAAAGVILCSTVLASQISAQTPARSGRAVLGTESEDYATGVAIGPDGDIFVTGSLGSANPPLPLTHGSSPLGP